MDLQAFSNILAVGFTLNLAFSFVWSVYDYAGNRILRRIEGIRERASYLRRNAENSNSGETNLKSLAEIESLVFNIKVEFRKSQLKQQLQVRSCIGACILAAAICIVTISIEAYFPHCKIGVWLQFLIFVVCLVPLPVCVILTQYRGKKNYQDTENLIVEAERKAGEVLTLSPHNTQSSDD